MSSPLYPTLDNIVPVLRKCALCGIDIAASGVETAVLACGHRAHANCVVVWSHRNRTAILGGPHHCRECPPAVGSDGGGDDDDNKSESGAEKSQFSVCIEELRAAYRRQFPHIDLEKIKDGAATEKDMLALLGPLDTSAGYVSVVRALLEQKPIGEPDAEAEAKRRRLLALRGDELIDELLRRRRTLDVLLATRTLTIAHLYRVGIDSMAALMRLGFDCNEHLGIAYYERMPPYFLALHYNFTYDLHMRSMTLAAIVAMQLKKQELRAFGIDAYVLFDELAIDSDALVALGIRPSALHDYAGVTLEQLLALKPPLTLAVFEREPRWNADRKRSPFTVALYDALRARAAASK